MEVLKVQLHKSDKKISFEGKDIKNGNVKCDGVNPSLIHQDLICSLQAIRGAHLLVCGFGLGSYGECDITGRDGC